MMNYKTEPKYEPGTRNSGGARFLFKEREKVEGDLREDYRPVRLRSSSALDVDQDSQNNH